jgi:NADH-quinone oxidoreductase subunit H
VLVAGSLRLDTIITQQAQSGIWNVVAQPLGFLVFFVAGFAESGRLPFDLAEAEQELVGGYHTEYGGIKLMLILVSEFLHMFTASFLVVILFFGGWHLWGVTGEGNEVTWTVAALRVLVLLGKVFLAILFFMVVRWSWPRFRFDQLMTLAWKVLVPLGLVNLVTLAVWMEYGERAAERFGLTPSTAMAAYNWTVLVAAWFVLAWALPDVIDNRPSLEPVGDD